MKENEMSEADKIITDALQETKETTDRNGAEKYKPSTVITGEDLLNLNIEELPYLVEGLLPQTGTIALAGSSDAGKSSFLRQLACAIVYGEKDFLGFEIRAKHNSVVYVSTEDDENALAYLLRKQVKPDKKSTDLSELRFIFESDDILSKIDRELSIKPADCVILDASIDLYSGDLNASNKVRGFIKSFGRLSRKHKCLFIFLHHTGKRTEFLPPSKDNLLGSQGFESRMRLVLELRKDYTDQSKRHLCIVKGNYWKETEKESSYVLCFDENLQFTLLAERRPFHLLAKPDARRGQSAKAKEEAIELKKQGLSVTKITQEMQNRGYEFGRSTIGAWVKCDNSENSGTPSIESTQ